MDPEFIKHLLQLNNPDAAIRKQAEELQKQQIETNMGGYLFNLARAVNAEGVDESVKQLAGIIVKNAINGPSEATQRQHQQAWLNIPPPQRNEIKQALFGGLGSNCSLARRGAASAVASIAMAELPVGEWSELITTLTSAVKENNPAAQEGALLTIALICEDLHPVPSNLTAMSGEILNAVVVGAANQMPVEIRRASIKAMYGALNIVASNFEQKQQRDYIMKIICDACADTDIDIQTTALCCLVRTSEIYYDHLTEDYMRVIWEITSKIMMTDSDSAPFTIEFWSSIAETEKIIIDNADEDEEVTATFSLKILPLLVPSLCLNCLKQADDTADADEWNIAAAAAACITVLSECTRDAIVPIVTPFIHKINEPNWRQREASTLVFGSIVGSESEQLQAMAGQVMNILLTHLSSDENDCVRATSAWAVSRVANFFPEVIHQDVVGVMRVLVGALSYEDPVIASSACFGLLNILNTIYYGRDQEPSNQLSQLFTPLLQELIKAGSRDDADMAKLRITVYETINTLIEVAPMDCLAATQEVVGVFLQKLEESFSLNVDLEDQLQLQAYIPLVLQTITQRLDSQIEQFAQSIYTSLIKVFDTRKIIVDEAMSAISSLFSAMPGVVSQVLPSFTPYLLGAIQNSQDASVLKSGLLCFGSICDALQDNLYTWDKGNLCNLVLAALLGHLQNPELERDLRPLIVLTFAEVAIAIGKNFTNYYPHIIGILSAASDITIPDNADDDTIDYVIALREAILEAYPPIVSAMDDGGQAGLVIPSLHKMLPFMEILWNQTDYRTSTIISDMVGVVNDVFRFLVPLMDAATKAQVMQMGFLRALVEHGMRSPNESTREAATWAYQRMG